MKKYDAILYYNSINESADERIYTKKIPGGTYGFNIYPDADDPKLYQTFSFANMLRSSLSNIGPGFFCKIVDFKKWVVVEISHHNYITGKTASKTFLIVFQHKGDGIVLNTHNKYRTISGVDQAASYIKSACSRLQSDTQNRVS